MVRPNNKLVQSDQITILQLQYTRIYLLFVLCVEFSITYIGNAQNLVKYEIDLTSVFGPKFIRFRADVFRRFLKKILILII